MPKAADLLPVNMEQVKRRVWKASRRNTFNAKSSTQRCLLNLLMSLRRPRGTAGSRAVTQLTHSHPGHQWQGLGEPTLQALTVSLWVLRTTYPSMERSRCSPAGRWSGAAPPSHCRPASAPRPAPRSSPRRRRLSLGRRKPRRERRSRGGRSGAMGDSKVKVAVRVRPMNRRGESLLLQRPSARPGPRRERP